MKRRELWPDVIRIFAACGVVTVHAFLLPKLVSTSINIEIVLNWLWFIIAKTCVPLFLMLSGSLLLGKKESELVFFKKRLKRVLLPWLFWTSVFLITKYAGSITDFWSTLKTWKGIFSAEFTFLPVLFCLYLLMPYFRILVQRATKMQRWQLIGIWFLTISILPFFRDSLAFPAIVDNGLVRQSIHYFGYLFLGYELRLWWQTKSFKKTFLPSLSIFGIGVLGTFWLHLTHPSEPPLFLSYVAPGIILSSAALFSLGLLIAGRYKNNQLITALSQVSFGVFFIHPLVILLLKQNVSWPTETFTGNIFLAFSAIALSFGSLLLLKKIPIIQQVVS
jgi:surface polysaccharide O-acyltransferase-like enzyme